MKTLKNCSVQSQNSLSSSLNTKKKNKKNMKLLPITLSALTAIATAHNINFLAQLPFTSSIPCGSSTCLEVIYNNGNSVCSLIVDAEKADVAGKPLCKAFGQAKEKRWGSWDGLVHPLWWEFFIQKKVFEKKSADYIFYFLESNKLKQFISISTKKPSPWRLIPLSIPAPPIIPRSCTIISYIPRPSLPIKRLTRPRLTSILP